MILVKKIYVTFLIEVLSNNESKVKIDNVSGYKLFYLLKDRLKYLKNDSKYSNCIDDIFSQGSKGNIKILVLDSQKDSVEKDIYRVRIEVNIFDNFPDIVKEFISDIYYIFKLGVDCDFLDLKKTFYKIISLDNTFKAYIIDFNDDFRLNTLEKLLSFSWNGLKLNLLDDCIAKSLVDFNGYGYSITPKSLVIDIKYDTEATDRFDLSIREYFDILYNEFLNILDDLNISRNVAYELFGFKSKNRIVNPIINLDFDINLKFIRFTIMKIKDINYIVGIILVLLKDLFNGFFVLDENLIFNDYYNDVRIGDNYIKIDEEKYLKALYLYARR